MAKAVISLVSKELLEEHLLSLTQRLLDAIANGDWTTYTEIVDESATCLEPEAGGSLIKGFPFHKFWFDLSKANKSTAAAAPLAPITSISNASVRLLGEASDVAVLAYTRIVQSVDDKGAAKVTQAAETRVFSKSVKDGKWRLMHMHRHIVSAM